MSLDLAPAQSCPLVLRPHPFQMDAGVIQVKAGRSLQAMLDAVADGHALAPTLRVEIGGIEVPRELWPRVRPKEGTAIHATVMPAGGKGGKLLRTVLLIVVAVVAIWVTGGGAAGFFASFGVTNAAVAGALVSIVGNLLVNALIPPPKPPSLGGGGSADIGRWNALTGSSNQANPYGPIPLVIGESRIYPPHAAMPYSELVGAVSYQRLMFDLGHGDIEVSDLKIGDTDLSEFDGVEYEVTKTPTLYTSDISELSVSATLNDSDVVSRTTSANVDEISLDVVFPQGLFGMDDNGQQVTATASFALEYRETGSVTWLPVPVPGTTSGGVETKAHGFVFSSGATYTVKTPDRKPFAAGFAFGVPAPGQYDVRITRNATSWGTANANSRIGDGVWAALRSIRHSNPSNTGTNKLCMRIKASEQLNGTLSSLSCLVRQKIAVYDRGTDTWAAPAVSLNTAWVLYWLLSTCEAIPVHVPAARIDLDSLADFADHCTANGFEVRGTVDARTTARALLDDVLSCSLGALSLRDGKYGVIFDSGTTIPTMAFTPLDMKGMTVSRGFVRLPHAFKVRFRNPAANWDFDEIIVLDDGYSYNGMDARGAASTDPEPAEFETLEIRFACDAHQAWRVARAQFAQAKFRPSVYAWETDIANLACCRGDLVRVAHDVTEWGTGWGRVVSLVAGGPDGAAATLVLDETIATEAGVSYSVRIRRDDASTVVANAVPHSADTGTFYLDSLPAGVNTGDVAVLGETSTEMQSLLITGVYPSADLGAKLTAVAYDSRVGPYWADPPAVIVSEITGTSYRDPPPAPHITVVLTDLVNDDYNDAGVTEPIVRVNVKDPGGFLEPLYAWRVA